MRSRSFIFLKNSGTGSFINYMSVSSYFCESKAFFFFSIKAYILTIYTENFWLKQWLYNALLFSTFCSFIKNCLKVPNLSQSI